MDKSLLPLLKLKGWLEAYLLFHMIYEWGVPAYTKITKKLCGELLCSPTKGKKAYELLEFYWLIKSSDIVTWFTPDFSVPPPTKDNKYKDLVPLILKLLPWEYKSSVSLIRTIGKDIVEASEMKRYSIEEFIPIVIKEIQKDNFWKDKLTSETFIRKFNLLYWKVYMNIAKKPWQDLSSLKEIF